MDFSSFESMRGDDAVDRAGFDIMLAVASARQASSPTARLSLRLEKQSGTARTMRDMRRALLAGHSLGPTGAAPTPGCFAALDVRTAEKT